MRLKIALITLSANVALLAQQPLSPNSTMQVSFPPDSPLKLIHADWGDSRESVRGGARQLDLRTGLVLCNVSSQRVRGVTLQVTAQEMTPGGRASVSVPSIDVGPGETFPVHIEVQLLRPVQSTDGPLVQIGLDGVLFADLSFYGPDKLKLQRNMKLWELEARRDRRYFQALLENNGQNRLREEFVKVLDRQAKSARSGAQLARVGRATAAEPEREMAIAFLDMPDSPVRAEDGYVKVSGPEVRTSQLSVANRGRQAVRTVEVGWLVRDQHGREFAAGAIPSELNLGPYQRSRLLPPVAFQFMQHNGQPIAPDSITGYISSVEFSDGSVWVPKRESLSRDVRLRSVLPPSPEEQRLAELYRTKGLQAVVEELKKF